MEKLNRNKFRAELQKIMPGYKWTVHIPKLYAGEGQLTYIDATGVQSAGFNRTSTLEVTKYLDGEFEFRSSGFGLRAPWTGAFKDMTLARALRGLQNYYGEQARMYSVLERNMERGRKKPTETEAE